VGRNSERHHGDSGNSITAHCANPPLASARRPPGAGLEGKLTRRTKAAFVLAFSCARAMFEEMAHFHFFLFRIEASHSKAVLLFEQEAPRFRKGKLQPEGWNRKGSCGVVFLS